MPLKPNAGVVFPQSKNLTSLFSEARQAYEQGMPLHVLRRRFHLSDSEAQDVAPEEFGDEARPEGVGGY